MEGISRPYAGHSLPLPDPSLVTEQLVRQWNNELKSQPRRYSKLDPSLNVLCLKPSLT